ncbi:hypothetical protein B0H13DRAFT_63485 [Mycena leptocephala]|nr:hypothetical protein B0H13DRAFT_63485 [Mycena leptocephala]
MQLEAAQNEILRAQGVVRTLEGQRDDAEQHASRARALARKLQNENRALVAREEGRREGYEAGFTHGKAIAHEQRRLEADIEIRRQRQIAAVVPEPGSAFIEELPGEEEGRRNHNHNNGSRGMEDARRPPPQTQAQTRARRGTVGSVRTIEARPAEPPPFTVLINNRPPPPSQRPASVASARRVSAPPVVTQQQLPRARTASIDSRARPPSRSSTVTPTPASNPYRTSSSASRSQSQQTQTHARRTAPPVEAPRASLPLLLLLIYYWSAATFAGNAPASTATRADARARRLPRGGDDAAQHSSAPPAPAHHADARASNGRDAAACGDDHAHADARPDAAPPPAQLGCPCPLPALHKHKDHRFSRACSSRPRCSSSKWSARARRRA